MPTCSARPSTAWSVRTRRSDHGTAHPLPGHGRAKRLSDSGFRKLTVIRDDQLTIVPANEASWADVDAVFGTADYCGRCRCQALKVVPWIWRDSTFDQRVTAQQEQTACGEPDARSTSGLIAYFDGRAGRLGGGRAADGISRSCGRPGSRGRAETRTRTTTASGR